MTQTLALLMDTYHELNAKKLFWITLVLSATVAGCLFLIGIDENGLTVAVWKIDKAFFGISTEVVDRGNFYKWIFSDLGIRWWLGGAAAVLAIISTASFFPDMMKPGSIDLLLTKPIGRLRLFLTRYALGLVFAFLQVLVFTTICFFAIGIRGGEWELGLFLAVPFFVLFFSYLFAVSVFVGVLTRSTIAALLVTLIFFVLMLGINFADVVIRGVQVLVEGESAIRQEHLAYAEGLEPDEREQFEESYGMTLEQMRTDAAEIEQSAASASSLANTFMVIKTPLPKTGETLGLLTAVLIDAADLPSSAEEEIGTPQIELGGVRSKEEILRDKAEELKRPAWWIVGTSLGFEFVLLGFAAWKFCRRDY